MGEESEDEDDFDGEDEELRNGEFRVSLCSQKIDADEPVMTKCERRRERKLEQKLKSKLRPSPNPAFPITLVRQNLQLRLTVLHQMRLPRTTSWRPSSHR